MRDYFKKCYRYYFQEQYHGIHAISETDCRIIELLIDIVSKKNMLSLQAALEQWKNEIPDADVLSAFKALSKMVDNEDELSDEIDDEDNPYANKSSKSGGKEIWVSVGSETFKARYILSITVGDAFIGNGA
ncbi:MAG: hypothetical protein JHC54_10930, partial [Acinetobacter sp.]|nr:hypothetical protein [Acinetobacter sp.]